MLINFKFLDRRKKDSVKITHIFPHHTNTCSPGKDHFVSRRLWKIHKSHSQRFDGINWSWSFCELLQRALPNNKKCICVDDVCNARVRAKMLIKQIKENDHSINTFQYNEDLALGLLIGLDDVTEDIIDIAI